MSSKFQSSQVKLANCTEKCKCLVKSAAWALIGWTVCVSDSVPTHDLKPIDTLLLYLIVRTARLTTSLLIT